MTRADFPWPDLSRDEVAVLVMTGFNAHEIGTVMGVPDDVGAFLRSDVLGVPVPRESLPQGCPQVFGVRLAA